MTVRLDHTIVPAKDKIASAEFFAEIFGLTVKPDQDHFAQVQVNESLTFDFADEPEPWGGAGFDPRNPFTGEAYVPMDECLARCVIDFSGRPYLVWRGMNALAHKRITAKEKKQDMSSAFRFGLAREFFQGFSNEARCNLHLELLYGDEPHHVVEALFKAFAKAVDAACQRDPRIAGKLPSTKGKL